MPEGIRFRERKEIVEEKHVAEVPVTPNLIEGREDGALKDKDAVDETEKVSEIEKWEIEHGKYGIEYLGIKELAGEFPIKAQFGIVDNYIKAEMKRLGYDTPGRYQEILDGLEDEIGSRKKSAYERVKKLSEYVKVIKKLADLEEKKKMFR